MDLRDLEENFWTRSQWMNYINSHTLHCFDGGVVWLVLPVTIIFCSSTRCNIHHSRNRPGIIQKKKILNGINNPLLFNNLQSMPQHMHYQVNIFWEILSLTAETYPARIGSSIHAVSHKKPNSAPTILLIEFNMIQFILRISLTDLLRHTSLPFFSPFTFTVSFYWSPSLFFFLVSLPCFPLFLRCPPPIHQAQGKMGLSCLPFKGHYDVMHVIVAKHTIRYITNAFIHQLWRWWN